MKKITCLLIIISLFVPSFSIMAYEYIDSKNSENIRDVINEIYDSRQQYEDLAGSYVENKVEIFNSDNSSYWWPTGSSETTEVEGKLFANGDPQAKIITSEFGYRKDPFGGGSTKFHSGLDISGGGGAGVVNVIAAKDGIVVYPSKGDATNCPISSSQSGCGGGYGNYVIIQHSDGNYTLYAHMHQGTVTVTAGESVKQGQVIGKMGSSGNSTGAHLHFEVREGQNDKSATVNPLNYISIDNPRIVQASGNLLNWLNSWEGTGKKDGSYYIVEDIGDGVRTVGGGVTLEYNSGSFKKYKINIKDYPVGSKIPVDIVDKIQLEKIDEKRSYIQTILSKNEITLKTTQIDALISQMYNIGNIDGFSTAYKKDGDTKDFYNNWFFRSIMKGSQFENGLTRRRNAEWTLFHNGKYVNNG